MKRAFLLIQIFACFVGFGLAQELKAKLDEAESAYSSGNLEEARFALQEALREVNLMIAREVISLAPEQVDDMVVQSDQEQVSGSGMGFAGIVISREYRSDLHSLTFEVIGDSPMLASITTLLNMPVIAMTDSDTKRIKVDGYKALMQLGGLNDSIPTVSVQLPFGSSLMSFSFYGYDDPKVVEQLTQLFPVREMIAKTEE
ncbi:MAG: hypothetical protein Kow00127_12450 [Bacteroidales bacterium]